VPWNDADPDADLRIEPDQTVDSVIAWYRAECDAADAIWTELSLDTTAVHHRDGAPPARGGLDPWVAADSRSFSHAFSPL
jgi:hypothetical protein